MNKLFLRIASLLIVMGLLIGCGAEEQEQGQTNSQEEKNTVSENSEEQSEEKVQITISKDKGSEYINEKEVAVKEGATLMEVMEENFQLETDFNDGFITSIDGVAPKDGEQKSWMFTVNGEMPTVGAKEFKLSPGDKVTFDLQAWE
ncbi:protein of unknown function [Virgibacillus subterraneus]|uniref:Transcobalamin-like C-terminal domain-containing protein n=1 Tax=Virgibacillus subterraneus TaxID=621109 RepID=A0A1H9EH99_9BACI|nr:DUF4430 domain-containing protein [Virgibacillus subterraneus]SEQ24633.1 protein of unknown function [Virgibacillus subterraneus]